MAIARAALLTAAAAALALVLVSGGSNADPRTPPALPGLPPPFLGTAVTGDGGLTAAVDAYGDVVDLRAPGPAGRALIDNPAARQAAGTVPAATGVVPRVRVGGGDAEPLWRADSVRQAYVGGTNVVRTVAGFGRVRAVVRTVASGNALGVVVTVRAPAGVRAVASVGVDVAAGARCRQRGGGAVRELLCWVGKRPAGGAAPAAARPPDGGAVPARAAGQSESPGGDAATAAGRIEPPGGDAARAATARSAAAVLANAVGADQEWLARARPLGGGAPAWAREMYWRSLLVLHALTDSRTGAVAAGARDGWAYVWPRDAATAAIAYAAAGYRDEAKRVASFLSGLTPRLGQAARFDGDGRPVPGRGPQGDASGWVEAARCATAAPNELGVTAGSGWSDLPDYQEGSPGTYLGNALAASSSSCSFSGNGMEKEQPGAGDAGYGASIARQFGTPRGLVREAGNPSSGLDSAAAWAVRPFSSPSLYPAARRTLLHLAADATPYGITPGAGWTGGEDPWTAPTAWSAWSLAALGDRADALRLLADLRRAATPAGALPERVDAHTGVPRSTTPLGWSHAFAILALRQLWPARPR